MADEASGGAHPVPAAPTHKELEEGSALLLDFDKLRKVVQCREAVLPVAVQDVDSREVLIVAFANRLALAESLRRRVCVLWSTSRNELWIKGATSGDYLDLVEVRCNCEQNSLLYLVRPRNTGACHTKGPSGATRPSCYYRRVRCVSDVPEGAADASAFVVLEHLAAPASTGVQGPGDAAGGGAGGS
mmetsp:Transcript_44747/g.133694  ORF Transcript_44747/g.133694 Transcript_44747/m.133694 type:complete len:187 (+) Transcript_44747:54-614(+)